ncbi:NAD(P)/FAD-dependent oxidoreductase [Candidatus Bathyarchaeota archaeon]|nr:MAG: NAD(P)/FAD-dependent oxidoreductase [Candidatus Bathyarchaeota archaeon]
MKTFEVVVVGGGPIGCRVAYLTSKNGWKTLLIEEHKQVGKPVHCTGKIYVKAFKEFELPKESIVNEVKGAYFYSPNNFSFKISKSKIDSYIVDREIFDLKMVEKAVDAGTHLMMETKCYDLTKNVDGYVLRSKYKNEKIELKAKIVVDAEGWNPILSKKLGLYEETTYLKGLQYEMLDVDLNNEKFVEVYFGKQFFPGFFGWIVPVRDGKARVGLCINPKYTSSPPSYYLRKALKDHPIISRKTRKAKIVKIFGGIIPIHRFPRKSFVGRFILVGDSAGHVKSTTGGGLYFGLKAATIAGEVICECLEKNMKNLGLYKKKWKIWEKELKFTSFARKILDEFSDKELNKVLRLIGEDKKFLSKIEDKCSSQNQSQVFRLMITNPNLMLKFSRYFPKFFNLILREKAYMFS